MKPNVPAGTALIVYVADDGTIIEVVDPSGNVPVIASPDLETLSGTKFVAAGETAIKASTVAPPTEAATAGATTMTEKAAPQTVAACCWCVIQGQLYCRLSCC